MIIWLYKKYKQKKLKKRLMGDNKHIEIAGMCECTAPDTVSISDYVYIGPNAKLYGCGGIEIMGNVIIGNDVNILTTNHNYIGEMLPYDEVAIHKKVKINSNVWVASNVFILPGVEIGEGAVIAGGSVVTKDVPPLAIVGGNPARVIKYRDEKQYNELVENKKFYLMSKYGE